MIFGERGRTELTLSGDRSEINTKLDTLRYLDQRTNTSGGLYVARTEVLETAANRPLVSDVMLVLTDGDPSLDVDL